MKKYIPTAIYLLVRFFKLLNRKKFYNIHFREEAKKLSPHGNYIMAVWHSNLVSTILNAELPMISMTSQSKDGEIASLTAKKFGIITTRGSSSRGGKEAMLAMIEKINETNFNSGLTIDGPRGPIHEPKNGIFKIAKETGVAILPYCVIPTRKKVLRSWDKFKMPLPFGTMKIIYGEPFLVDLELNDENLAKYREKLKLSLLDIEQQVSK